MSSKMLNRNFLVNPHRTLILCLLTYIVCLHIVVFTKLSFDVKDDPSLVNGWIVDVSQYNTSLIIS